MNEKKVDEKCIVPSFFMGGMMRLLSELETEIWAPPFNQDKVKMQNIIIALKSGMIQIDGEKSDIISVNGVKYKRVMG